MLGLFGVERQTAAVAGRWFGRIRNAENDYRRLGEPVVAGVERLIVLGWSSFDVCGRFDHRRVAEFMPGGEPGTYLASESSSSLVIDFLLDVLEVVGSGCHRSALDFSQAPWKDSGKVAVVPVEQAEPVRAGLPVV